jgi:hypothetical protein
MKRDYFLQLRTCCRVALAAVLLATGGMSCAEEPPYTSATARAYLGSKSNVAVLLRLDGGVSAGEYDLLLEKFAAESLDTQTVLRRWREDVNVYREHRVAVLRTVKGSLKSSFSIPASTSEVYRLPLGQPVLVFLDADVDYIGACDVFGVDQFPPSLLSAGDVGDIINEIVTKRLSVCARMDE